MHKAWTLASTFPQIRELFKTKWCMMNHWHVRVQGDDTALSAFYPWPMCDLIHHACFSRSEGIAHAIHNNLLHLTIDESIRTLAAAISSGKVAEQTVMQKVMTRKVPSGQKTRQEVNTTKDGVATTDRAKMWICTHGNDLESASEAGSEDTRRYQADEFEEAMALACEGRIAALRVASRFIMDSGCGKDIVPEARARVYSRYFCSVDPFTFGTANGNNTAENTLPMYVEAFGDEEIEPYVLKNAPSPFYRRQVHEQRFWAHLDAWYDTLHDST